MHFNLKAQKKLIEALVEIHSESVAQTTKPINWIKILFETYQTFSVKYI